MKHTRSKRTPDVVPEWYRKWEMRQFADCAYVMDKTVICSPAMYAKLKQLPVTESATTYSGLQIVVSEHFPPPKFMNRRERLREIRKKERHKLLRAIEQDKFERRVHGVMSLLEGMKRPFAAAN